MGQSYYCSGNWGKIARGITIFGFVFMRVKSGLVRGKAGEKKLKFQISLDLGGDCLLGLIVVLWPGTESGWSI